MSANIYDWSLVAANNSNSDGDLTWAEGQAPSTVNNSARVMMQRVKQLLVDIGGSIAAGGTPNGLTVTASNAFTAYADGQIISFRAIADNTAAATLNVNGIGAKAIQKMDSTGDVALTAGEIQQTGIYVAQYSAALNGAAGAWLLVNPTLSAAIVTLTGTQTLTNKTLTTPTLTLKQSANPTPTAEGDLQWDTDDNQFVVGDGANTLYPGKLPTAQTFTANGTWTKPAGCRRIVIEGVGGGGGSGGINGTAAASGVTAGGGSGFYGLTTPLDVTAVVSAAVTIGAAGAAGSAVAAGGNGGNTAITIGATTFTWGGGTGSDFRNAGGNTFGSMEGGVGGTGTNLAGGSQQGGTGVFGHTDLNVTSGAGGGTPLGTGGISIHSITGGSATAGQAGAGRGAGGGGAINLNSNTDQAGAVGTAGYMRIWEYY